MCYYIGIEDLAANALIESMNNKKDKVFFTYEEIEKYGAMVIELLNENSEKAILILSRESTDAMFRNYSEFFEEYEEKGQKGIKLRENVTKERLISQFRGYLALDVLKAFVNVNSINALGL